MKRRLKIVATAVGTAAVLFLAILLVLPLLLDPNAYKPRIAELVETHTGLHLGIAGSIELGVFPRPWAEASGLTLGEVRDGEHLADVDRVRVDVALWPLLAGRVAIASLRIDGPRVTLRRDAAGRVSWADAVAPPPASPGAPGGTGALGSLALGGIEIHDGTVLWRDEVSGQDLVLGGLRLRTGPLRIGEPVEVDAHFQLDDSRRALRAETRLAAELVLASGLDVLDLPRLVLESDLRGDVLPGGHLSLVARGDGRFDFPSTRLTSAGIEVTAMGVDPAGAPMRIALYAGLDGDVRAARYLLPGFVVHGQSGEGDADGAELRVRSDRPLVIDLAAGSLDAGMLTADLKAAGLAGLQGRLTASGTLGGDLTTLRYTLEGIDGRGELARADAPARRVPFELGGDISLGASDGTLAASNLRFTMAGVRATGEIDAEGLGGDLLVGGRVATEPFDPRAVLERLGFEPAIPAGSPAFHETLASARFAYDGHRLDVSPLSVALDDAQIAGELSVATGDAHATRFDLRVDRLDLDAYLTPGETGPADPADVIAIALARLRELDLEGRLRVDTLIAGAIKFEAFDASMLARDGMAQIDPVAARLQGGRMDGALRVDARPESLEIRIDQRLTGVRADRLLAAFDIPTGGLALRGASDITLAATVVGDTGNGQVRVDLLGLDARLADEALPAGTLRIAARGTADVDLAADRLLSDDLHLAVGTTEVSAKLAVDALRAAPRISGTIQATDPDLRVLVAQLLQAPVRTADPATLAKASLTAKVSADARAIEVSDLAATLDEMHLQGSVSRRHATPPVLRFDLDLDRIDLDRYLPLVDRVSGSQADDAVVLPFAALADMDVDGNLRIGVLEIEDLILHDVTLAARSRDGVVRLEPMETALHGAADAGNLRVGSGSNAPRRPGQDPRRVATTLPPAPNPPSPPARP